jgi:hypothetical protein
MGGESNDSGASLFDDTALDAENEITEDGLVTPDCLPELKGLIFQTPFEAMDAKKRKRMNESRRRWQMFNRVDAARREREAKQGAPMPIWLAHGINAMGSLMISALLLLAPVLHAEIMQTFPRPFEFQFFVLGPVTLFLSAAAIVAIFNGFISNWNRSRKIAIAIPFVMYLLVGFYAIPLYYSS